MSAWRTCTVAVDEAVFRGERRVVSILFLGMAVVVFADVVHRIFSRDPGRLAVLLAALLRAFGIAAEPEWLAGAICPALVGLTLLVAMYGVVRTRSRAPGVPAPSRPRSLSWALGLSLAATALVQGFLLARPEGVVWASYLALCVMLWVGLLGASMATHKSRHLALEMGEQLWPAHLRPRVRATSQGVAGLFCGLIALLALVSLLDHVEAWNASHQADLVPSIDLPKWAVFVVIPYAFTVMALRFFGRMSGVLPSPPSADLGS